MNTALVDNLLLLIAALVSAFFVYRLEQRITGPLGSFFAVFPVVLVLFNMLAHLIAIAAVNYDRYQSGAFTYTFVLYGQVLFAIVSIVICYYALSYARKFMQGRKLFRKKTIILNGLSALLFLPLVPFNPISMLPVIAAIVSSISISLARAPKPEVVTRKRLQVRQAVR
jgi:hypothetical protein